MSSVAKLFCGEIMQIAGVASFMAGMVLSLHHWPAAAALIFGIASFYAGKWVRKANQ